MNHRFSSQTACSLTETDDLTRDLTVLSLDFAVKIMSDFHAKRSPQNQSNLLQVRLISEQVIKGHNKKHVNNNS